jgi:hypothetical protein
VGRLILGGLGVLGLLAHAALVFTSPWSGRPALFLVLAGSAAAVAGVTALLARHLPSGKAAIIWVVAVSLAAHALWLVKPPGLSEDVYRYAFEGRLVRAGVSPYQHPPDDVRLVEYRDPEIWPHIGHKELSTIYPPLSLVAFAIGDALGGVNGERALFGFASVLTAVLLLLALKQRGEPPLRAAAYAWAPLPALEYAGSGHHDSLGILLLVAAVGFATTARPGRGALAWALSVGVKGFAAVTLPVFWRQWGWRDRVMAVGGAGLLVLPLVLLSRADHSGLRAYAQRWQHNDLAFGALAELLRDGDVARVVSLVAIAAVAIGAGLSRLSLSKAALACLGGALFFSPTLHPWYTGWVLALAPLVPSAAAWLLGQTVLVSYALPGVQETPGFAEVPISWRVFQWGLPLAVGVFEVWRRLRAGKKT